MTLGLNQHLVPSAGGGDDGLRVGGPDEGFGIVVVLGEVAVDRGLEIDQRVEYATLQAAPGELGEEALDGIEPGRRGWREVEGPARVASERARPGPWDACGCRSCRARHGPACRPGWRARGG